MIRGQKRIIPKKEFKIPMKLHNRFDIEVVDSTTGKVKQRAQAENVICSNLWVRLFTPTSYFKYIHYGTGSGTPASTDTSLFTFLGYKTPSTSDDTYYFNEADGYGYITRKIILNPEDNVGSVLTEVGIAYGTASTDLCTHALLKDMNGNPISISKTSTDLINIYATVYVHWSSTGYNSTIFVNLEKGTKKLLYVFLGMYNSGKTINWPEGMALCPGCMMFNRDNRAYLPPIPCSVAYSSATKTATITATRISASEYNGQELLWAIIYGGYNSSTSSDMLSYPCIILKADGISGSWFENSVISGEPIGTGDGVSEDFKTDFPFSENAVIYIDGVEEANVTVESKPLTTDMGRYFIGLSSDSTNANHIYNVETFLGNLGSPNYLTGAVDHLYYNPNYSIGVASLSVYYAFDVLVSNDLITWVSLHSSGSGYGTISITVPAEYQNYKYWKFYHPTANSSQEVSKLAAPSSFDTNNIHFATPPASGAVITADYTTKAIAKDANHVFDVSVVITLGEYTQ